MKRYILISLAVMIAAILVVVSMRDTSSEELTLPSSTTAPLVEEETSPAFQETEETLNIPDPCVAISIENVSKYVPQSKVRGPLLQTAAGPTKSCEWNPAVASETTPRLTVSIAGVPNYFDSLAPNAIETLEFGSEAFVIEGKSTAIGGDKCGRTMVVKLENFSYVVSLCKKENVDPTNEELIEIATDISNSLI